MAQFNKVIFLGNLTRDPEMRTLPGGTPVCTLGLASNRSFTGQNGEKKEDVCFIDVVVFGKAAESCGQYLTKGRQVLIEGRLQYRTWEKDDRKHSKHEIVADRVQFIGGPKGKTEGAAAQEEEVPF